MITEFGLLSGFLLGLASSLHCAGMCGPIASSMLFALDPDGAPRSRLTTLLTAQSGKAVSYIAAGALLGAVGSGIYGVFDQATAYRVLQWAAAASLSWIGLSVAGVLPPLSRLDGLLGAMARMAGQTALYATRHRRAASFLGGLAWGLLPCGMVFAALFTAMLAGSASAGAVVMTGFALGTLPAVTASALGLSGLRSLALHRSETARRLIGLAIMASGTGALLLSMPGGPLCIVTP